MRFVLAIVSFILAAVTIGVGIGQRTFLAGPEDVTAATTETTTSSVVVIDGSALNAYDQAQDILLSGSSVISAAYGRSADVTAWVGDTTYTRIGFDEATGTLVSEVLTGTETEVPPLAGSDLWLREYTGEDDLRIKINVPEDISVIAISDGVQPAPSNVSITWPLDNSAPWSGPLTVAGAVLLLLGLAFLIWALTHMRNSRGPRRSQQKQPKMPKLPRQPRYKPSKPKALAEGKGRRTRRFVAVTPIVLVGALTLAGCSVGDSATSSATASSATTLQAATGLASGSVSTSTVSTDDPEETAETPATVAVPAVTEAQVTSIIRETTDVIAKADSELDKELAATRLDGPALQLRLANYTIRKKDKKIAPAQALPTGRVSVILPQQSDTWPRTVFAVVNDQAADVALDDTAQITEEAAPTTAPMAFVLIQDDARSNYKVHYAVSVEPDAAWPDLAPASVGAARLSPDFKLLQVEPVAIGAAYGDILMKDTESTAYNSFEVEGDTLRTAVGLAAKKKAQKDLPATAKLTYSNAVGDGQVVAMATADSGAIVAVQINETEVVKPVKSGATVTAKGAIKALSGKTTSTKGLTATYGDQLLFYVPSSNEPDKIVLLGFAQGLIAAKEAK